MSTTDAHSSDATPLPEPTFTTGEDVCVLIASRRVDAVVERTEFEPRFNEPLEEIVVLDVGGATVRASPGQLQRI